MGLYYLVSPDRKDVIEFTDYGDEDILVKLIRNLPSTETDEIIVSSFYPDIDFDDYGFMGYESAREVYALHRKQGWQKIAEFIVQKVMNNRKKQNFHADDGQERYSEDMRYGYHW